MSKIKKNRLKELVEEVLDEMFELGEQTTTADITGYDAPAFKKKPFKRKKKRDDKL